MIHLLSVLLLISFSLGTQIEEEEGVLVLTQDNFQEAIDTSPALLVEFYAPWCGHCKKLAPEYAAAALMLNTKGSEAKLAKVDATIHKELAQQYGVKGFPTLIFFKKGVKQDYTGGRTADTIVSWLDKKTAGVPYLFSTESAEALIEENKVVAIGFFENPHSKEADAFKTAADSIEDVVFGITSNPEIANLYNVIDTSTVVLFKKFDEGRNELEGDVTVESVKSFVAKNYLPLVVDFNTETAKAIFQGSVKKHFIIFSSAKEEKFEYFIHDARKVAADYKGDVMFVTVTTDEDEHKRVVDFFGITDKELPTFRITATGDSDMLKYKPEDASLTEENMRSFLKEFLAGSLSPHLKSEDLPEDWDSNPVKVLVSSNFLSVAMEEGKDVLVEFYAPWCGHCKKLAPIWDELGDYFKEDENVVIAKIDMTANELETVKVRGFPTIKLFSADNTVRDYSGSRTLDDLVKFLKPPAEEAEEAEEMGEVKDEL